ncbi:hypothetical protein BH23ACT9_BH23ACT9_09790 [soil metagenome]
MRDAVVDEIVDIWKAHDLLRANDVAIAQGARDESHGSMRAVINELG